MFIELMLSRLSIPGKLYLLLKVSIMDAPYAKVYGSLQICKITGLLLCKGRNTVNKAALSQGTLHTYRPFMPFHNSSARPKKPQPGPFPVIGKRLL